MKKNFLNNQNYILGKTEKKKILSKFFVELLYKKFREKLIKINTLKIDEKNYKNSFLILLLVVLLFILWLFYRFTIYFSIPLVTYLFIKYKLVYNPKAKKHLNIKNYFLYSKKYISDIQVYVYVFMNFIFIMYIWTKYHNDDDLFAGAIVFSFLLAIFLLVFFNKILFRVKILNLLLFPFFIIYLFFYSIIITFNIFILKWTNWYLFHRYRIKSKILEKFTKIEEKYGKNKYYRIEIKKY